TGDPARGIAGEEDGGGGDVFRYAEALERDHGGNCLLPGLIHGAGEVRLHQPGGDAVDPDVGRQLGGQVLREVDHRRLGGVVDTDEAAVVHPADGGDVDDVAAVLLHVAAVGELGPHQQAAQVDLEGLVVAGQVDVDGLAEVRVGGGVVDEDVEGPEALERGVDRGLGLVGLAGVGGDHVDLAVDLGGRLLQLVLLARGQHHLGAGFGHRLGDGEADALGGTGDKGCLAVESQVHAAGLYALALNAT